MQVSDLADIPNLLKLLYRGVSGKGVGFSFNVSERCPIGCRCYWRERVERLEAIGEPVGEMGDNDAVEFFEEMKSHGYLLVTLVGGEPYVRPALLEKLTPIMPANWIVTSGTTPLRHFPKTTHFISIDGGDAGTHNAVRRSRGLFERIVRNLGRSRAEGGFPAFAHSVLNAQNYHQIEDILRFWSENGLLDGVTFSTLTPIHGSGDNEYRLSRNQREWIVEELIRQKQSYGEFMVNTVPMINLFHPDHTATQAPKTCGTARLVPSFGGDGKQIEQCILGDKADCSQCGCVITSMMETMFPRPRLGTVRMLATLRAS